MYIMEVLNGEKFSCMKSKKIFYSGKNDFITIIASAEKDVPGYIRVCSGNFVKDKKFRYNKCEIFTTRIEKLSLIHI